MRSCSLRTVLPTTYAPDPGVLFPGLFPKPVVVTFDQRQGNSDGGALLLRAVDLKLGLLARLTACLTDPRQPE